ncbi:MAG: ATP-dependent DNA helicase [Gammaproteobacteria bacterium]|nr:ATP-dependent DNA helicase [Gammaproteobacteria bacterium]
MNNNGPRQFRISVTELAEFCCRRGDLNLGLERTPSAQDGQRGQRMMQANRPPAYQREISVNAIFGDDHFQCTLAGRIDGLLEQTSLLEKNSLLDTDPVPKRVSPLPTETPAATSHTLHHTLLEEIKTTYCSASDLPPAQKAVNWAQLQLYGALYLQQHTDEFLDLQLTYFKLDDESQFDFQETASRTDLETFYADCVARYSHWLHLQCEHLDRRDAFLQTLPFPFHDFRPGQRALSVQAYRDLRDGTPALYQAATGLGKTAGILYPALKLLGENRVRQIFYLTAKTSGQRSLTQALQQIAQSTQPATASPPLRVLFLGARERQCFCGGTTVDLCNWQQGYHDRLPDALLAYQQQPLWHSDDLLQLARRFALCPHQLSRHLLPWVDLVIADFNYVFDPYARLQEHLDTHAKNIALLVDEAHNLPERARDMFSAQLQKPQLQAAAKQIKHAPLKRRFRQLLQQFPARGTPQQAQDQLPETLVNAVTLLAEEWLDWHAQQQWLVHPAELFEAMMACVRFARRAQQWQPEDRLISGGDDLAANPNAIEIFCTDPAPRLRVLSHAFSGCVFFSGSLLPLAFFAGALSDEPFSSQLNLPSPFPPRHQCTLVVPINTRFDARAHSIAPIAELITTVWQANPGRYLVSFPSYPYLQDVLQYLQQQHPELPLLAQTSGTQQANTFLQQLAQDRFLALVISGGSFAEGLDLQDNKLHGVIVIGTCMPPPSLQRELIRQQADARLHNGFDFAYRFPGLNRVLQSAGRVIRSETDRGVVILADDRFTRADTRPQLPSHWQLQRVTRIKDLAKPLQEFWSAPV